jgi:3-hydroxyisobutyrate dehydrogenase-like beta-hydroxyacid dehydrogenase
MVQPHSGPPQEKTMTSPTVAVIAPGNMGAAIGARLVENGVTVLTSLEGRSAASAQRAKDSGLRAASETEIAAADIILSIVPPGEALALAQRHAPALKTAPRKPLYADCNAVSPQTVEKIAAIVTATRARFADGGIVGGPPKKGQRGPRLYVSGADAKPLAALAERGLDVRVMDAPVGGASALKMVYGGLNKGVVALGAAMALAAHRAGVGEDFHKELQASQGPLLEQLSRGVPDMFSKAYRWVAEMEEIADFTGKPAEAKTYEGFAQLYERLARDFESAKEEIDALAAFYGKPAKS